MLDSISIPHFNNHFGITHIDSGKRVLTFISMLSIFFSVTVSWTGNTYVLSEDPNQAYDAASASIRQAVNDYHGKQNVS
jgi:hypothetical protein